MQQPVPVAFSVHQNVVDGADDEGIPHLQQGLEVGSPMRVKVVQRVNSRHTLRFKPPGQERIPQVRPGEVNQVGLQGIHLFPNPADCSQAQPFHRETGVGRC